MPAKLVDLTGKTFGRWTVLFYDEHRHWRCRCECGTVKNVHRANLISGTSKSC